MPEAVVQVKHRKEERCERWTPASRGPGSSEVAAKGTPECGRHSGRLLDGESKIFLRYYVTVSILGYLDASAAIAVEATPNLTFGRRRRWGVNIAKHIDRVAQADRVSAPVGP